jgi:4-aminobutyrate aminotransferase-like enzyme
MEETSHYYGMKSSTEFTRRDKVGSAVPTIVGGQGVYFTLADGRRVLDGSNTGGPLGHQHPAMVEAISRAAAAPVVNESWAWAERQEATSELLDIAFGGDEGGFAEIHYCLSGSEANDLALSLAQALTGRETLATRERAYHGGSGLARDVTVQPHCHGGLSWRDGGVSAIPRAAAVVQLPAPIGERIGGTAPAPEIDAQRLHDAHEKLADAAAVIVDYTQGGIYHSAAYQDALAAAASTAGALWIADEVVTGFGRTGVRFSFEGAESRPDLVTLGKGLGGGAAPAGAVVISKQLANRMTDANWKTSGTFRGHPLTIAAIRAHLRVFEREGLADRAAGLDEIMYRLLVDAAARHPCVRRIDGRGLHWTVELHGPDWRSWRGEPGRVTVASLVAAAAREAGALIGTSDEETSLFLAPPLIVEEHELHSLVEALDHGLTAADHELGLAPT